MRRWRSALKVRRWCVATRPGAEHVQVHSAGYFPSVKPRLEGRPADVSYELGSWLCRG